MITNSIFSDIDECLVWNSNKCGDSCENLNGTYRCTCGPGLTLSSDQKTCEGKRRRLKTSEDIFIVEEKKCVHEMEHHD